MKRIIDFTLASAGLVVLAPLGLLAAIGTKLSGPGPIFFRQERLGLGGTRFRIFKFRTMIDQAPGAGAQVTAGSDARITPFGRFLRRHKIDELPQLINVLRGEMSLVGPRPEVPEFAELFPLEYACILKVRPGITHRATLRFRREEALLASVDDPRRFYVESIMPAKLAAYQAQLRQSIWEDIKIILATVLPDLFYAWRVAPLDVQDLGVQESAPLPVGPGAAPTLTLVANVPPFPDEMPTRLVTPAGRAQSEERDVAVV